MAILLRKVGTVSQFYLLAFVMAWAMANRPPSSPRARHASTKPDYLQLHGEGSLFSSLDCQAYGQSCFQASSRSAVDSDRPLEQSRGPLTGQPLSWFWGLGERGTGGTEDASPQSNSRWAQLGFS